MGGVIDRENAIRVSDYRRAPAGGHFNKRHPTAGFRVDDLQREELSAGDGL